MPPTYEKKTVKKKPSKASGYKPVTVYVTKRAKKQGVPAQRAVSYINKSADTKLVKTTKKKAKADIVVKSLRSPQRKKRYQGRSSEIPTSRKQIEKGKTKVRVQPRPKRPAKGMRKYMDAKARKGSVHPAVHVTTHELGHAIGLTHHEKQIKNRMARGAKRTLPPSIMSGGVKFTETDIKRAKKVTGYTKAVKGQSKRRKYAR